jgi:DnaJ family protein B protein 12
MSVANAEESQRALNLARTYYAKGSLSAALKWARKSSALSPSSAADALAATLEKEIATGASSSQADDSKATKATGAEAHPSASGAHQRPGHASSSKTTSNAEPSESTSKKFTPEQTRVVKRVIACKAHDYYSILSGKFSESNSPA